MIEINTDIAIIGLGPAGFSSARNLVEKGFDVVIIERSASLRKVCGGLLCEEAQDMLRKLNCTPRRKTYQS